ncbi:MAG: beta-1,6-N-acetylglucosaminyltransferase [Staphylococcus epidermidis]|nr:beta-1,6-N-acetylglucosaminyltransferase [Staphylococcus epidermidis]
MKHAIMIMGYGDGKIVQNTINILDDPDIDFFIHWDKKFKIPDFKSSNSQIFYTKNRRKVFWGTDTQTMVEKMMLEEVYITNRYDYVHLISSNDMPLMTPDYFKRYFTNKPYAIGFLDYIDKQIYNRAKYFYPIRYMKIKSGVKFFLIIKNIEYLNKILGINRLKNKTLEKGCNWFSMNIKYVEKVINFKDFNMFKNTFTGDEFFIQTILKDLKPECLNEKYDYYSDDYRMTKSSKMASRYIDWLNGHGKPYVFTTDDAERLKKLVNTEYAFCRKIDDYRVIPSVFDDYLSEEGD